MHIGKWAIILAIFWLLLSGYFQPLLLGFGIISIAVVLYALHRMDSVDHEPTEVNSGHRIIRYSAWLLGQITLSSLGVTRLVWGSNDKLTPTLEKIPASGIPADKRVLYANSITLTPGTLSLDLKNDEITVHALQKSSLEELKQGGMEAKITSMWEQK